MHARYPRLLQTGFTLIELLVVVSIIAVLASLLLPAISLVKTAARGTTCVNVLRQYQMANSSYCGDNDGRFVQICGFGGNALWSSNAQFTELLETTTSIRWPKRLLCPESNGYQGATAAGGLVMYSYGMNVDKLIHTHGAQSCSYVSSLIRRPAEKIAISDSLDWWTTSSGSSLYVDEKNPIPSGASCAQGHCDSKVV
jgi:prepilin-type N-terminal cleavage/methylation domain-containing protein